MPAFFGTENDVLGSLPNNKINKGRGMPEEHKIFMEKYEKYGNNCTLIAKVLNTQTPAQIKKHAECFFTTKFEKKFCSGEAISRVSLSQ